MFKSNPFGFIKGNSTVSAIYSFLNKINISLDNKEHTAIVLICLNTFFNRVNNDELLTNMETFGIKGNSYHWIRSFILGRKRVKIPQVLHQDFTRL